MKFSDKTKFIIGFILINLVLLFLLPTSPLYPQYNSCKDDAGIYQLIAREMYNGKSLYTEIFDHKGPFIFFIYLLSGIFVNQANLILFLIDGILINLIFLYSYKTLKLKTNNKVIFLIFVGIFLFLSKSMSVVVPEMLMLLAITYMNYWILSKQYLNPTFKQLLICGILTGLIFWIKYSLCVYIGIIYLYFAYMHIKNKTFNYKYILYPLIGFLIPTIIVFGYFIYNNNVSDLINIYFLLNMRYGVNPHLEINLKIVALFVLISLFALMSLIKNKEKEISLISISYFILFIVSFIMTGKNYYYYYLPFVTVLVIIPYIFNIEKLKKTIILFSIILSLIFSVVLILESAETYIDQINDPAKDFYELAGEDGVNNSVVVFLSSVEYLKYSNDIKNKYFFSPSLTYEQYPEIWDEMYEKTLNKEYEYLFFREVDDRGTGLAKFKFVYNGVFEESNLTMQKANEIYENISKNYYKYETFKYRSFVPYHYHKEANKLTIFPKAHSKYIVYKRKD